MHAPRTQSYAAGRWGEARQQLEGLLHARTAADGSPVEDGPCASLLAFMAGHGFAAPPDWCGVRELTEK